MDPVHWIVFVVMGGCFGAVFLGAVWTFLTSDRTPDSQLGTITFADQVWFRSSRHLKVGRVRIPVGGHGRVRVLIGQGLLGIRAVDAGRWNGALLFTDFTFRTADCEVAADVGPGAALSTAMWPGRNRYLLLQGTNRHGTVQMMLWKPAKATLDDLERELIRAGVKPTVPEAVGGRGRSS